ncbi:MAG: cobalamin B12-binding domain-containing protein [Candidatus Freyarchaeota archaeon]
MRVTLHKGKLLEKIRDCIVLLNGGELEELIREALTEGIPPLEVLNAMSAGMDEVGKKYESQEYFLSELIFSGEIFKKGMALLEPHLKGGNSPPRGVVVVGTIANDLHDIGKNIFLTLLMAAGFKVVDLGVDVPPEKFVEAIKENHAEILGISALLTATAPGIREVIRLLEENNLRGRVKVIVGGAALTREMAEEFGADAYAKTAVEGVEICKRWVEG